MAGTGVQTAPTPARRSKADGQSVRRALAHCDRVLDVLYRGQRSRDGLENVDELVYAVEAVRTELARLER
jgi:hypothetical protein